MTQPAEYTTNTDESDVLALDMAAELTGSEAVSSAECELRRLDTGADVTATAFTGSATVEGTVVSRPFDARNLAPVPHEWIWNVTLNSGSIRSYKTILRVEDHD